MKLELSRIKTVEDIRALWTECEQEHGMVTRRQIDIVKHCIDNEIDLSWLAPARRTAFMLMAQGQVLIETFEVFGETCLWNKIRRLPLSEQKRLSEGGRVNLLVRVDGKLETRKADPLKLSRVECDQVFGPNGIQDEEEQRSFIDTLEKTARKSEPEESEPDVIVKHGKLIVNRPCVITAKDLAGYLARIS